MEQNFRTTLMIPAELKECKQWVNYLRETKAPVNPWDGSLASSTDRRTWSDFLQAYLRMQRNKEKYGIGFVFTPNDPYAGVDLDSCLKDGQLLPWAASLVDHFASYTELSPSGRGLHILIRAQLPTSSGHHPKGLGLFDRNRYFTVTNRHLASTPREIFERQRELDALLAEIQSRHEARYPVPDSRTSPRPYTDEQVIRYLDAYPGKRCDLWRGDWQKYDYASQSEALFGFLAYLKTLCADAGQMRRVLLASPLAFGENGEMKSYIDRSIRKILEV